MLPENEKGLLLEFERLWDKARPAFPENRLNFYPRLSKFRSWLKAASSREPAETPGRETFEGDFFLESRPLRPEEIQILEKQGNSCENWALVRVGEGFDPSAVRSCQFFGLNYLGFVPLSGGDGPKNQEGIPEMPFLPVSGLYHSAIADSFVDSRALVCRSSLIQSVLVESGAKILNSQVLCDGDLSSVSKQTIKLGNETGGRELALFADLSFELAELLVMNPGVEALKKAYEHELRRYDDKTRLDFGVVGAGSVLRNCPSITNSLIGEGCRLDGALAVDDSVLLGAGGRAVTLGPGTIVRSSVIQEGCALDTGALVKQSFLFECCRVQDKAICVESLVGPNSSLGKGEMSHSFVGPFTGFNHQSMLISTLWPRGRGNVAHGAKIGSNHTSRLPDQECEAGEGMFFGLGSMIKFPANYRDSPYSIVASGVVCQAQRLEYPFSLVNPSQDASLNVLVPGWCLRENLYFLYRNEEKYRSRNRARRISFDFSLFRPEIIDLLEKAILYLEDIKAKKDLYYPGEVRGLGKNILREADRLAAIETYRFHIDLYRLRQNKDHLRAEELIDLKLKLSEMVERTEFSIKKDHERGNRVFDDYEKSHVGFGEDSFLRRFRFTLHQELAELEENLGKFKML